MTTYQKVLRKKSSELELPFQRWHWRAWRADAGCRCCSWFQPFPLISFGIHGTTRKNTTVLEKSGADNEQIQTIQPIVGLQPMSDLRYSLCWVNGQWALEQQYALINDVIFECWWQQCTIKLSNFILARTNLNFNGVFLVYTHQNAHIFSLFLALTTFFACFC